ncbi:MAG: mechanosensitive ion channel family protein [Methanosarcinaceae archaeon]|nr:mechanosensitive ion channel family protein [Methanosarcinaceae archaeon]
MNVTDPTAVVSSMGDIVFKVLLSIATILIAVLIGKVISIRLRRSFKEKINKKHLDIIIKIVQYSFIIFVLLIFVLPILGVQPSSLLVSGSIAGLVIGFASQSIVSNLISRLFLMIERPIKVGDNVNISGVMGTVEDISIISTIIRNYDRLYIRMPNETVFTNTITNYVANVARRFEYVVGIRYSDDADMAIGIIKELIEAHPFALKSPVPQAFVDNLGDNSVNIIVRIWSPSTEWYGVKMELLWVIKKTLEENGIEIAFSQRTMWFANEIKKESD